MNHTQRIVGATAESVAVHRSDPGATFAVRGVADAVAREVTARVRCAAERVERSPRGILTFDGPIDLASDLAVAMSALGVDTGSTVLLGQLGFDGELRPVRGVCVHVAAAREQGHDVIVPRIHEREAGIVDGATVYSALTLSDVLDHFEGRCRLPLVDSTVIEPAVDEHAPIHHSAQSQLHAAVGAGDRTVLMIGPPGAGKTLLALRLGAVLGPMSLEETMETTALHSIADTLDPYVGYVRCRPFRAPHHTVSEVGLVGGGVAPRPGEISLAHNGVLLLDELPEFRSSAVEAMRQPLEDGRVCISRSGAQVWFPANPRVVVAAANPCACGSWGRSTRYCSCSPRLMTWYTERLEHLAKRFQTVIRLESPH